MTPRCKTKRSFLASERIRRPAIILAIILLPSAAWSQGAPAPPPPILFRAGGSLETTFTDNVDPALPVKDADLLGSATATGVLRGTSRRGELSGTINLSYDYYTQNTRLNGLRYNGLLASRLDLIEDMLDLSANASTSLQATGSQGAEAATERLLGGNQTQIFNTSFRPQFRTRIGDFAETTLTYDFSSVVLDQPSTSVAASPASDSLTNSGQFQARSGPQFESFGWSLGGRIEETRRVGTLPVPSVGQSRTSTRRNGQGSIEYEATSLLQLIATGGVDDIEEPSLTQPPDGTFGTLGFDWRPSDRTSVRVDSGYRYQGPTLTASVAYQPREWFRIGLNIDESIETQQRLLGRQLNGLIRDGSGNLIDSVTGGAPDPNQNPFDITDQAFRLNRVQLSVGGQFQRTTYSLTGGHDSRDSETAVSKGLTFVASITRQLAQRIELSITGQYNDVNQGGLINQSTETIGGSVRLDYQLGPTVFASAAYTYLKRTSPLINSTENAAVLSLARRF